MGLNQTPVTYNQELLHTQKQDAYRSFSFVMTFPQRFGVQWIPSTSPPIQTSS